MNNTAEPRRQSKSERRKAKITLFFFVAAGTVMLIFIKALDRDFGYGSLFALFSGFLISAVATYTFYFVPMAPRYARIGAVVSASIFFADMAGAVVGAVTAFYVIVWPLVVPFIIRDHLQNPINLGATSVVLLLAVGAHKFRCRHRLSYGALEIFVGLLGFTWGIHSVDLSQLVRGTDTHLDIVITQMAAGMFVMVRGLSNVHDAIGKQNSANRQMLRAIDDLIS